MLPSSPPSAWAPPGGKPSPPIGTIDLPAPGGRFFMRSCRVLDRSLPSILLCCRPLGVGLGGKPLWEVASKLSPVPMAGLFCRVGNRRRRWPPTKPQEAENRTGLGSQEDRI